MFRASGYSSPLNHKNLGQIDKINSLCVFSQWILHCYISPNYYYKLHGFGQKTPQYNLSPLQTNHQSPSTPFPHLTGVIEPGSSLTVVSSFQTFTYHPHGYLSYLNYQQFISPRPMEGYLISRGNNVAPVQSFPI